MLEIRTFSDMQYCVREIRYWLEHGDFDKIYSNRGQLLDKSRGLMKPAYVHLWMIMYPLQGQEDTRKKNIRDLAVWLKQICDVCDGKIQLLTVFDELEGSFLKHIKSDLGKNHGYKDLKYQSPIEVNESMSEIFSKIVDTQFENRKKDKLYKISIEKIEDIIKEVLELNKIDN